MARMKLRAEKKMRQHLMEQIKARKVAGSRLAEGGIKTADTLQSLNLSPSIYMYKNLMTGQVLYSQVPGFHQEQIDQQFSKPNWENRKPSRRNDLWKIMCVANFNSYDNAVTAYKALLDLRFYRDHIASSEELTRKKNDEGNIWSSGQYRPTYSQEAISDLSNVIDTFELASSIFWENLWRKGEDKHWRIDLTNHETLPPFNQKHQSVMLDELREKAVHEFAALRERSE